MTIKDLYPTSRPSLDLNFARTKRLDPRVTFSRASSGTYFDANGVLQTAATNVARFDHNPSTGESLGLLVEESRTNVSLRSEDFSSTTYWTATSLVAVPNTELASDGKYTACKLTEDTSVDTFKRLIGTNCTVTQNSAFTVTAYVKAAGRSYVLFGFYSLVNVYGLAKFDLTTGTYTGSKTNPNSTFIEASIQSAGNGWYRLSTTWSHNINASARPQIYFGNSDLTPAYPLTTGGYTGDGTSGIYIWGAQLEVGSFPTSYIKSNDTFTSRASTATYYDANGVLQTAGIDIARSAAYFPDSNGVMKPAGLLLEAASTNLVTYSEQFNNAAWTKAGLSISANSAVAPDGTTTADTLVPSTNNEIHTAYVTVSVSNTGHSRFVYAKAAGYSYLQLDMSATYGTACYANFDLQNGVTGSKGGTVLSSGIEKLPNGWYKCYLTAGLPPTGAGSAFVHVAVVNSLTAGRIPAFAGDGTSGIYVWGAQLEASSYPTSYIPTTSATVTRSADVSSSATVTRSADLAQMTGTNFSSWYRQDEGTIYCRNQSAKNSGNGYGAYVISDNTASNRLLHAANLSGTASDLIVVNGGVEQVNFRPLGSTSAGAFYATSFAYKANSFAGSGNGGATVTDAAGSVPSVNRLDLGFFYPGSASSNTLNGTISRLAYYPTRLTDAQLQALTAS